MLSMYFGQIKYFPMENGVALHQNKLEFPASPKDAFVKFHRNCPCGYKEEEYLMLSMYFKLLHYYLPLEKGMKLHLNKVESHFPKNAKCKVWWKLTKRIWKRRLLDGVNVFLLFHYFLHLEKLVPLHLNKTESTFCQVWFWHQQTFDISHISPF